MSQNIVLSLNLLDIIDPLELFVVIATLIGDVLMALYHILREYTL